MNRKRSRGQRWDACDADIRAFVERVTGELSAQLNGAMVGTYLHGSLAMGCFHRSRSDLDLLAVVSCRLGLECRSAVARTLLKLSDSRPIPGDLGVSVVDRMALKPFVYPTPYQVHFGSGARDAIRSGRAEYPDGLLDKDLAAHCTVIRSRGVALAGAPIPDVFGEIAWPTYVDSILYDFASIVEGDNLAHAPIYGVLNCCRVLQVLTQGTGTVVSKEEGGRWGLAHLPRPERTLVGQALECYRGLWDVSPEQRSTGGLRWDIADLRRFRDYVVREAARLMPDTARG